eukprot:Pgem_evm1s9084
MLKQSSSNPSLLVNDHEMGKTSLDNKIKLTDVLHNSFSSPFDYKSFENYCKTRYSSEGLNFINDYRAVLQAEKN